MRPSYDMPLGRIKTPRPSGTDVGPGDALPAVRARREYVAALNVDNRAGAGAPPPATSVAGNVFPCLVGGHMLSFGRATHRVVLVSRICQFLGLPPTQEAPGSL